jgi:PKHD-type hydroxylase
MNELVNYVYWRWEGALSKEFCEFALQQIDWSTHETAWLNRDENKIDLEKRRTDIVWQDVMQPLGCIARTYMYTANQSAGWGYEVNRQESIQIGRYRSENEGHYDWHIDSDSPVDGVQRKLSISILLSDPSEFEGGELQFKGIEDNNILTKQGTIVVFPSFVEHRVTPVTKGVRYSAVTWASGPSFR